MLSRTWLPVLALAALSHAVAAQGPPPLGPLPPPPFPPGNPITTAKTNLGKVLFWDEQMSSTNTTACGSCHVFERGGSDPRSSAANPNPGLNGLVGDADDVFGSPGVPRTDANGMYSLATFFRLGTQVTGRKAPSVINSAYIPATFWDGRALPTFVDPQTNQVVLQNGASLESQVVEPPISDVEMGHVGIDWDDITAKLATSSPLRLAPSIPVALSTWIAGRTYPQLFQEAFGTPDVTAARVALSIATYERVLVSNQAPFDQLLAGNPQALTPEENNGFQVFNGQGRCNVCHAGPRLSNDSFRYIGVRPQIDDLGRFNVTGQIGDRGRMKVPSLRNVDLRSPYFHTGRFGTIEDVIAFYNRGGDFNAPNKDPNILPLGLSIQQRADLAAFLRRPLTDPRVQNGTAPFDHPTLNQASTRVPEPFGVGTAGTGGFVPRLVAIEPPYIGNPRFTVALDGACAGKGAILAFSETNVPGGVLFNGMRTYLDFNSALTIRRLGPLAGGGEGQGFGSGTISIPNDPLLFGRTFYAQAYVLDVTPGVRFAATEAIAMTRF